MAPSVDLDTAAGIVNPHDPDKGKATLRQWVHRGHITRNPDGSYDLMVLLHWIDARSTDALMSRAGIPMEERP